MLGVMATSPSIWMGTGVWVAVMVMDDAWKRLEFGDEILSRLKTVWRVQPSVVEHGAAKRSSLVSVGSAL